MRFPWLTARPIAHRGLHGPGAAPVENTIAAAEAAIARGYAIECDVRPSRDGVLMVHHDATLDRLTCASGRIDAWSAADLARVPFRRGPGGVPRLVDLLAGVAGAVPVFVEIKSAFDRDPALPDQVAATIDTYQGPLALKSFDVDLMHCLRDRGVRAPLGIVGESAYAPEDWPSIDGKRLRALRQHTGFAAVAPDFLSWCWRDLGHPTVRHWRRAGVPVLAWTIRDARQYRQSCRAADQIIFEGDLPRW